MIDEDIYLTKKQKAFLLYMTEHPTASMREASEAIDINAQSIYNWRHNNPAFKKLMDETLEEAWASAKYNASQKMFQLGEEGDFKALKYILDYNGFAAPQKVEATVDNTIHITIGDD